MDLLLETPNNTSRIIKLPPPRIVGGKPFFCAVSERKTMRTYRPDPLTIDELSLLLWAACGVNREDNMRTNPTAGNCQEITVLVCTDQAVFRYDPLKHRLTVRERKDLRALTGEDAWCGHAPLEFVIVADLLRLAEYSARDRRLYAATDTGYVSQNLYLACASMGLATCARGWIKRPRLHRALKLKPDQKIILAQTVGHPSS